MTLPRVCCLCTDKVILMATLHLCYWVSQVGITRGNLGGQVMVARYIVCGVVCV